MTASPPEPPDDDSPPGDGSVDASAAVVCPYCGETSEIALDPGGGDVQEYVEDCQVCCRPCNVVVEYAPDGAATVTVSADDAG